jgi:hypothetical protein
VGLYFVDLVVVGRIRRRLWEGCRPHVVRSSPNYGEQPASYRLVGLTSSYIRMAMWYRYRPARRDLHRRTTVWGSNSGAAAEDMDSYPRVTGVRIMDPTTDPAAKYQYPNRYVSYENSLEQTVDPYSSKTISKTSPWWHWSF